MSNPFANPFADGAPRNFPEPEVKVVKRREGPLITEPGAYPDIEAEDYHGNIDLLPEPSLSSTGVKTLLSKSPFHFWHNSPLNPNRPPEVEKIHFAFGKMAHDIILLPDRVDDFYHVLPTGFAWNKTVQFECEIEEAKEAREAGKTLIAQKDADTAHRVAEVLRLNDLAMACLTNGVTEETLVWKDEETGVWLRARPDFRPNSIVERRELRVVADLKFVAETHMSPKGFSKAIANFGYHISAAMYWEGIEKIHGIAPTHWVHVPVEKDAPHSVAVYELPMEDIERGRQMVRRGARLFANCLSADKWPGYADEPRPVGLPIWARMNHDNNDPDEAAFAAAS